LAKYSKALAYVLGGWEWNNVIHLATEPPMDIQGAPNSPNDRADCQGGFKTNVSFDIWIN